MKEREREREREREKKKKDSLSLMSGPACCSLLVAGRAGRGNNTREGGKECQGRRGTGEYDKETNGIEDERRRQAKDSGGGKKNKKKTGDK